MPSHYRIHPQPVSLSIRKLRSNSVHQKAKDKTFSPTYNRGKKACSTTDVKINSRISVCVTRACRLNSADARRSGWVGWGGGERARMGKSIKKKKRKLALFVWINVLFYLSLLLVGLEFRISSSISFFSFVFHTSDIQLVNVLL